MKSRMVSIARFSEDLDFALERPEAGLEFADVIGRLVRDLTAAPLPRPAS